MRPLKLSAALLASAGLLITGCTTAGSDAPGSPEPTTTATLSSETQAELQGLLDDARAEMGFPGVIAGVWSPEGSWTGVSGTAGKGETRPPEQEDHTRIGSLTKTMTVTSLLQLMEQGKLSLDDPIGKYVPGMPNGETATLENLSNMTSGIPSYTKINAFTKQYADDPETVFQPQQLVDYVKGKKPMFKPGTEMFYSNTNTVLLGMVIEQVTGQSIEKVFQEGLFEPLGMGQTSFPGTSPDLPTPCLSGSTEQGDPVGKVKDATLWNPSWGFTAGAVISTLEDLHKWGAGLGTGEGILTPETQQMRIESFETQVPPNAPELVYGLGAARTDGWIGHVGTLPGYNTSVQYDPASKTTIVVMVNSDIPIDNVLPADAIFEEMIPILS